MAIALELETRDQIYKIYGGSAGFTKVIQATGLVGADLLTTEKILEVFSDLERRKAIVSVLLDEGEFDPEPDFSSDRKREALVLRLAKQLDTGWIIKLIARLANELNEASTELSGAASVVTQEQIAEHIRQDAIARQSELPLEAIASQSNIAEGE